MNLRKRKVSVWLVVVVALVSMISAGMTGFLIGHEAYNLGLSNKVFDATLPGGFPNGTRIIQITRTVEAANKLLTETATYGQITVVATDTPTPQK